MEKEEIELSNNFNKLKKYALNKRIKKLGSDKIKEIKEKLLDNSICEDVEVMKFRTFTLVGKNSDSPVNIKFMNKIEFIKGQPTHIADNEENKFIISKIENNPAFIPGEITQDELYKKYQKEDQRVLRARQEDIRIDSIMQKKYNGSNYGSN